MEQQKPDPTKVVLSVTKSPATKPKEEIDPLEAELNADINAGIINGFLEDPKIKGYLAQAAPFLPMAVGKAKSFFGKDKKRIMCYLDEETDALVIEILETDNIANFEYKSEPKEDNFFIIQKKDLDQPADFLKMLMAKSNISLF